MSKGGGHSHHHHSSSHHHHHHHNNYYGSRRTYYSNGVTYTSYSSSSDCSCHPIVKLISIIAVLGTLISLPLIILSVGSHKELDMDPDQTTLKSLHPIWTKSVTITDKTGNGNYLNAGLYSTKPIISQNKTHMVSKEESPLIDIDSYMYYSYQLNEGSSVSITFTASQAINFYVQQGESQFKKFTDDVDAHYYKLKRYCDNGGACTIQYQIGKDDIYFFTFQNPSYFSQVQVSAKLNLKMTLYEPTSQPMDYCLGSGNVAGYPDICTLKLPFIFDYSKKLYLLITAPEETDAGDVTYPTEYKLSFNQVMVWGQGIISMLALLLLIWVIRLYLTKKCFFQKNSESLRATPSISGTNIKYSKAPVYTAPAVNVSPEVPKETIIINESTSLFNSNDNIPNAYPISSVNSVTPSAPVYQPNMDINQNNVNSNYHDNSSNCYNSNNDNNNNINDVPYGFIN